MPDDIEEIHLQKKNLTYIPCLKRFHKLKKLYCDQNQLTSLPELNDSLQYLYCHYNKLTSLPKLNYSLRILFCHHNQLTYLPKLNDWLEFLSCFKNQLTYLPELNHSLRYLYCNNNQLTFLPQLNKSLSALECSYNRLTFLPQLNDSLQYLNCTQNPLPDIILNMLEKNANVYEEKINRINHITNCLHRCKMLFWCLKYKQKFRDWLWLKVRLPKIENMYHPSKLNALLNEKNDDITEEELDNVISSW